MQCDSDVDGDCYSDGDDYIDEVSSMMMMVKVTVMGTVMVQ